MFSKGRQKNPPVYPEYLQAQVLHVSAASPSHGQKPAHHESVAVVESS